MIKDGLNKLIFGPDMYFNGFHQFLKKVFKIF